MIFDILIVTETKMDLSFSSSRFSMEGFLMPFRFDRNRSDGVVTVYVWDDILSKQLTKHKLTDEKEDVFIEVNLRKTVWLIFGNYCPRSQRVEYFFKLIQKYMETHLEETTEPCLCGFFTSYDYKS